jgi:hypothetical protein
MEAEVGRVIERARGLHPGVSPRIIFDNGLQFVAANFKTYNCLTSKTHVRTAPYYLQSNGNLEWSHKTIKGDAIRPKGHFLRRRGQARGRGIRPPLQLQAAPFRHWLRHTSRPPSRSAHRHHRVARPQARSRPRAPCPVAPGGSRDRPVPPFVTRPPRPPTVSSLCHQPKDSIHAGQVQASGPCFFRYR